MPPSRGNEYHVPWLLHKLKRAILQCSQNQTRKITSQSIKIISRYSENSDLTPLTWVPKKKQGKCSPAAAALGKLKSTIPTTSSAVRPRHGLVGVVLVGTLGNHEPQVRGFLKQGTNQHKIGTQRTLPSASAHATMHSMQMFPEGRCAMMPQTSEARPPATDSLVDVHRDMLRNFVVDVLLGLLGKRVSLLQWESQHPYHMASHAHLHLVSNELPQVIRAPKRGLLERNAAVGLKNL